MAIDVGAARQRIIRRPRLTSMLDDSNARIRLLIAPAGYGKTTLAREWLGKPKYRDVWYRGGPASADVAALAAGLSEAVGAIVPEAGSRMLDRLRATGHPEEDVDILAELFAEDVQEWPRDAWLALDDYQFAMESVASERFVDLLTQQTPVQMLITSRRRPSWATARRILYGEVLEIDRRALAMEDAEARAVLGRRGTELEGILRLARGWPAVLGLAGLNSELGVSAEALPDQLYDYFAQELYEALDPSERLPLAELSFAANFDRQFAESLLGTRSVRALEAGLRIGVVAQPHRNVFELHPLFSSLLQDRAFPLVEDQRQAGTRVGLALLGTDRWDDAFALATRLKLPELLIAAFSEALESLMSFGRLATITRWLEAADALHCKSPILDLAEAEVAFRVGDWSRAEALAAQAAMTLEPASQLASRAYVRAGHGALLDSREEESITYFVKAEEAATGPSQLREALFGLYSAMSEIERPEASGVLDRLQDLELKTPDDYLRSLAINLTHAVRSGNVERALRLVRKDLHALETAKDPLIITSFLHAYSSALTMHSNYLGALEVAERLHAVAAKQRLNFVRPFALIDRGVARIGLRQFARAKQDVDQAERAVGLEGDVHIEGNLVAIRCRLLVALGRHDDAIAGTQRNFRDGQPTAPLRAEILAGRALAMACASQTTDALHEIEEAERVSTNSVDTQVLGPAVRSICSASPPEERDFALAAWGMANQSGNFNSFVAAYRGYPDLLKHLSEPEWRPGVGSLVQAANDVHLAKRYGLKLPTEATKPSTLTPRETEVMNLVASGLSNKEVAGALFVTDSTVKAHLRHVYEKLGVRGRAEAVAKWLTRQ